MSRPSRLPLTQIESPCPNGQASGGDCHGKSLRSRAMYPRSGLGCCSPGQCRTSEKRPLTPSQLIEGGSGLGQHGRPCHLPPPRSRMGSLCLCCPVAHLLLSRVFPGTYFPRSPRWLDNSLNRDRQRASCLGQSATSMITVSWRQ